MAYFSLLKSPIENLVTPEWFLNVYAYLSLDMTGLDFGRVAVAMVEWLYNR